VNPSNEIELPQQPMHEDKEAVLVPETDTSVICPSARFSQNILFFYDQEQISKDPNLKKLNELRKKRLLENITAD
jgi:hypothetical protein